MNLDNIVMVEALKELGFGASIGFLVGFTIKRAFKIIAFILGLYILSLLWLADNGVITVNWTQVEGFVSGFMGSFTSLARTAVQTLSFLGSFAVGFAVGLKV